MNTLTPNLSLASILAAGLMMIGTSAFAGTVSNCDRVSSQVRAEVEKDPAKVLMVVEDFMVANESCACEIVKAAILASKADADMVKQIVVTATNVSPNMSKVIVECASAVAPEHAGAIQASNENTYGDRSKMAKHPTSIQPVDSGSGGSDSSSNPAFMGTGVYLVQPSAGGLVTSTETVEKVVTKTKKVVVVRRTPPDTTTPQSPAEALCACACPL